MAIIPYWEARHLIVVDTQGIQIEHVKAVDPQLGWVEVWATYECHPGHKSVWLEDGKPVERDYMLLRMTDMHDGRISYMSRVDFRDFDVVNKYDGLVVHEVRQRAPSRSPESADSDAASERP